MNDNEAADNPAVTAYVGLGSNLGDRERYITEALGMLDSHEDIKVVRTSALVASRPVGGPPGQGPFLNAAAELRTTLPAAALLETCLTIERRLGRVRAERWGPRTIDLDILLYGDRTITTEQLQVPHPLMHERSFVIKPLAEIAPNAVHPVLKKTVLQIAEDLSRR